MNPNDVDEVALLEGQVIVVFADGCFVLLGGGELRLYAVERGTLMESPPDA